MFFKVVPQHGYVMYADVTDVADVTPLHVYLEIRFHVFLHFRIILRGGPKK